MSEYAVWEEKLNVLTHASGVLLSVVLLLLLWYKGHSSLNALQLSAVLLYGLSLCLLFLSSTLYHAATKPLPRALLKRLDHSAIYMLIAGTYTPFLTIAITTKKAHMVLIGLWVFVLLGIIFKVFLVGRFEKLSLMLYLAMGWVGILFAPELSKVLPLPAICCVFAGGVLYTLGAFFYANKRIAYNHAIWHVFVLAAAFVQAMAIYLYVIPPSFGG